MRQVSLGRLLNLFFAVAIILPLVVISSFAMYYSKSFLNELSKNNNLQIVENMKVNIESFFEEPESDLMILRDLLLVDGTSDYDFERLDKIFGLFQTNQNKFHHYQIIDRHGIGVYGYPETKGHVGFDYSNTEYFKAINSGQNKYWSKTYVDTRHDQISINFSLPLNDQVLVGTIPLESLKDVLKSILDEEGVEVGITDSSGVYILHSNYEYVNQQVTDPFVNHMTLNYDEVILNNVSYYGTNRESEYQGWNIVLYEHVSKQGDKVIRFMLFLSVFIVISTLVVIVLGNRLNGTIIENLSKFVAKTKYIADGDYSSRVEESQFIEFNEIGSNFTLMADQVKRREMKILSQSQEIESMNRDLEKRVEERTLELQASNEMLEQTLHNLNETREQLIESEKLASLGNLVAGLAHEINTPLGIILTVVTFMQDATDKITRSFKAGTLKKDELHKYFESIDESESLIFDNVTRTTDLIGSFKMISADQSSNDSRSIDIGDYLENIVRGLEPNLKKSKVVIEMDLERDVEIVTIPGAVYQVMVNLIMNSAVHAYEEEGGRIVVKMSQAENSVEISVEDFGQGISEENQKHIFEPFFTTRRGTGGTGLGLNIAYNAIKQRLKGNITLVSELGKGTKISITLPLDIESS